MELKMRLIIDGSTMSNSDMRFLNEHYTPEGDTLITIVHDSSVDRMRLSKQDCDTFYLDRCDKKYTLLR